MVALAVGVETCAALLSVESQTLRGCLERGEVRGVRLGEEWRVSLFEVARLLSTSVPELLCDRIPPRTASAGDLPLFPVTGATVAPQPLRSLPLDRRTRVL
jgi:hypothetical protein